jgi:hypothetical protein
MKSQALQELVKNIFSDEKTKVQFQSDPESVISQFDLSEEEKSAVLSTRARLGLATSATQLETEIGPLGNWI